MRGFTEGVTEGKKEAIDHRIAGELRRPRDGDRQPTRGHLDNNKLSEGEKRQDCDSIVIEPETG